jgi:hypothetical protein
MKSIKVSELPQAECFVEGNLTNSKFFGVQHHHQKNIERPVAVFETTLGTFEAELYAKECPETVWNFINIAEGRPETQKGGNFYDGVTFHRIIPGFVIQGGYPLGTGTGDPGYRFKDEFTLLCATVARAFCPWQMRDREPMAASFSSPWPPPRTWTTDIPFLEK